MEEEIGERGGVVRILLNLTIPFSSQYIQFNMDSFLLMLMFVFISWFLVSSAFPLTEFAYPNFTASNLGYVDSTGAFLFSRNGTFKVAMFNPNTQQNRFYLCVIHVGSNMIIWSANRDLSVSKSGIMSLTTNGISIKEQDGTLAWSTPPFQSLVTSLQITENGNLILLDQSNMTLWESFRNPTDTIVIGQQLTLGKILFSAASNDDLSRGNYGFALTASDAVVKWQGFTYWKLSMDTKAYVNSNYLVEYMIVNQTGLYIFSNNGTEIVIQVNLPPSEFRVAKIEVSGEFIISSFSGDRLNQEFIGPIENCRIPFICGKVGLCTSSSTSVDNSVCSCPFGFRVTSSNSTSCVPVNSSYSLPVSCYSSVHVNTLNFSSYSYLELGHDVDYFANDFTKPAKHGVSLLLCQGFCSNDCTCLGIFYKNSSGSCYTISNELGSFMMRATSNGRLGFVKVLVRASPVDSNGSNYDELDFPTTAAVLLPLSGLVFVFVLGIILCRKYSSSSNIEEVKSSYYSKDMDFCIPGLPLRFEYEELKLATNNFKTKIGSGGFGTVYKGILPDKTLVAVKKINDLGIRGKKDFCTEIAIIGNIHHVNLVKLKGYCAQKRQWLLVYEYMNRGSLDKTLFGNVGPVLEWQERVDIALGAARGLAYLHNGCQQKIIHCDVKPENILLHDRSQAKISDFGLSKLLTSEQSSQFTTMRGTRGYLAPEWLTSSAISDKTDVYSFGMALLEIVSGRKNCAGRLQTHSLDDDNNSGGESANSSAHELIYFPLYALDMHEQRRYLELVDHRIKGRVTNEEAEKLVRVALCCVQEEPGLRPSMINIVGMLEGEIGLSVPRIESLNFLRFYGRRFAEASMLEGSGGVSDMNVILFPDANNASNGSSTMSASNACVSYISSQQVSGPR